jgi:DNA-binding GntR family transcriptional regulator
MSIQSSLITPRSLDVQAADILREQILTGAILPGARLLEVELAGQFSLSRGTIRSALQQLTYEGLVVQYPYRGCAVCSLSSQDAWELYTLRQALESLAARLAAAAMTLHQAAALEAALQQIEAAVKQESWSEIASADFALHQAIIHCAGHQRLQQQYKIVEQQIRLYIISCNALQLDLNQIAAEHRHLVKAIISGDEELAEQVAKQHNTDGPILVEHLRQMEQKSKAQE